MRIMTLNKLKYILATLALWLPCAGAQLPQNYAYGANLETEGNEPFYRVILNNDVYTQTAWSDLRDVQIFNRHGQPVPMAFQTISLEEKTVTSKPLLIFPMHVSTEGTARTPVYITVASEDSIKVDINQLDNQPRGTSYFIKLPEKEQLDKNSKPYFKLHWQENNTNWEAKVNIYESYSMRSWNIIADNEPIMDLRAGNERLLLNHIQLIKIPTIKNWLFVVTTEPGVTVPKLDKVEIIYEQNISKQQVVDIDFTLQSNSQNQAIYTLPTAQPLRSLQINLQQSNTVMPLEISYTNESQITNKTIWKPLKKTVIYQLNHNAEPVMLSNTLIKAIRLKAINTAWVDKPPSLQGQRNKVELVFNSGNNGPFILAWGSKFAKPTAMSIESLIPATLRQNEPPKAWITTPITLTGEKVLTGNTGRQESSWLKWVGLILGAFVLILMAYKLSRELISTK